MSRNLLSHREKLSEVLRAIQDDPEACDLKMSFFCVASVRSYHQGMFLKPVPTNYSLPGDVDIEGLIAVLKKIPPLEDLHSQVPDDAVIEFLHWLLVELTDPLVTRIEPIDAWDVLEKFKWNRKELRPSHLFKLTPNPESPAERKFQEFAGEFPTKYAFHGSKAHNFHSIVSFGLAQHLNKRSAFGEGTYLSSDLSVCFAYSPSEPTWMHSRLGKKVSCVALCEYVEHPQHLQSHEPKKSKVPRNIVIVSNNEIIRVRYLLVYGWTPRKAQNPEGSLMTWMMNHKATLLIISYAFLLLAVNYTTSGTSWWTSLHQTAKRFLPSCFQ